MRMMLCVSAASGKIEAQLMLMMLGVVVASGEKSCPADAYDAGRGCGVWEKRRPS